MPRDDVAFGYDPRPFMKGLGVVTKGLGNLTKKVTHVAGQITRNFLLVGVAIKAGQALIRKFNQYVPEVGKAFNIAGKIFFKNFFWPIRRMLMPMLQRMLDWVRDHRTLFVKWGTTLANMFKVVVRLGGQLVAIFRTVIETLGPQFKRVFGRSFQDFINVITVKLAVALEFVGRVMKTLFQGIKPYLKPIVDNILAFATGVWDLVAGFMRANEEGKSLWTVLDKIAEFAGKALTFVTGLVAAFGKGFVKTMEDAMTPLDGIATALLGIFNALVGLGDENLYTDLAEGLGEIVGKTVMTGLHAIWGGLLGIEHALRALPLLIEALKTMGDAEKYADVERRMDIMNAMMAEKWGGLGKSWEKMWAEDKEKAAPPIVGAGGVLPYGNYAPVKDAIITKRGEVVRVDPNDTIMATRDPGGFGGGNMEVNVNLYVTEGNARNAGTEFASGLEDQLRRSFLDSATAGGY